MENIIAKRIMEILPDHIIQDVGQVNTKPGSSVYRIRLHNAKGEKRELYAKKYGESYNQQIHEMMELKPYHGLFLIPRILDYHDEFIISEGVTGDTLTRVILRKVLSTDRKSLLKCSSKIGQAIGALQHLTNRGTRRIGGLNICMIREIESEEYFNQILEKELLNDILHQVEELKELKTRLAQYHGDPSPHNILLRNDQVFLLDYSFQDNATFMDPSLYLVSLELMKNRMGYPMTKTISQMEKCFMQAYSKWTDETYDQPIWSTIKTLTYLHFLLMYAKREKTIKKNLVSSIDKPYLLKQIKRMNENE